MPAAHPIHSDSSAGIQQGAEPCGGDLFELGANPRQRRQTWVQVAVRASPVRASSSRRQSSSQVPQPQRGNTVVSVVAFDVG